MNNWKVLSPSLSSQQCNSRHNEARNHDDNESYHSGKPLSSGECDVLVETWLTDTDVKALKFVLHNHVLDSVHIAEDLVAVNWLFAHNHICAVVLRKTVELRLSVAPIMSAGPKGLWRHNISAML